MHERFGVKLTNNPQLDKPYPILGEGRVIFIGHMSDMWASNIYSDQILSVLDWCKKYENQYVFQSKNPDRITGWGLPRDSIVGTTIESDLAGVGISQAPGPIARVEALSKISFSGFITFITIEPILDFNLNSFLALIGTANPDFVNIGADSKGSGLDEPSADKVKALIQGIQNRGIEIRTKHNLARLLNG
jgi:protein gp37